MGRFFAVLAVSALLLPARVGDGAAQPAFFSLLFPQLIPECLLEGNAAVPGGEAVLL